jgi:hypothetical protein
VQAVASDAALLLLCHALALNYGELYGVSIVEKAQELMALCVRHGRVHELNRLLQLKRNTAVA